LNNKVIHHEDHEVHEDFVKNDLNLRFLSNLRGLRGFN